MKIRHVKYGVFTLIDNENLADTLTPPEEGFYWIDADLDDITQLQLTFGLHDLAVEDMLNEEEQRPKIEIYDNHYFIVVNSIRFDNEEIFMRALNIFLGRHFVITLTRQKIHELRTVKPIMWEEEVHAPDRFMYLLIDRVIDNFFAVGDRIEDQIERLEEDILMHTKRTHLNDIIGLRAEILWLKKVLVPQREVINILNKKDLRLIDDELQKYFSDIYENAVKVSEAFDTYRDLMGNLREAYQSSISNSANEIMKIFTVITTIFMPLTVVTGIYGMNFDHMPELHWTYGYPMVIGLMIVLGLTMYFLFRKKGWL
ncbi:magnesium and cobalt transport protein CorA [Saccharibacillus sp. O23]|uniref:magnesium/cobalt transporter CorA n=1 Tax=Saccharibacillus sp. O23 TaxID=2009338 RepID=UPI000B4DF492|nr:magnesium/cobalt transporter CorA [Saccharibacillus sp. O23]OWR28093.1 magnesium and cobalt transport protein CorA [Saccharibacillus sp. O23]